MSARRHMWLRGAITAGAVIAVALAFGCAPSPAPSAAAPQGGATEAPPVASVDLPAVVAPGETSGMDAGGAPALASAERTVSEMRPRLRACYDAELRNAPLMSGSAVIATRVEVDGHVSAVESKNVEGLSESLIACIERVVKAAMFEQGGVARRVNIPVRFKSPSASADRGTR